ncbi:MAG: pyridoxamine 5'-phosphate oxidase family protein [Acidimicrobiia bacterium]
MVLERLRDERNLWLATTRADGRPHLAPVWFTYVDDRLWIGTGAGSVRVRNLRQRPTASASLEGGDEPVVAEATAVIHDRVRPPAVVAAFREKYGWDILVETDDDIGAVVLLELRPHRWLFGVDLPIVAPGD